jgi:hypothetical protein
MPAGSSGPCRLSSSTLAFVSVLEARTGGGFGALRARTIARRQRPDVRHGGTEFVVPVIDALHRSLLRSLRVQYISATGNGDVICVRVLISNDDGYRAEGLRRLAEALRPLAEITIVAPDRNRSGAKQLAHARTDRCACGRKPRTCTARTGTPTDCVHLAITGLLPHGAGHGDRGDQRRRQSR